ncbi:MAG: Gfo/Idh/MocA family oxidoreductase [Lachnospiraceae bacterium]|nr:Gfo/Idh/MocA family oxidoreductase [Lachnospiraceae bacterium]
MFRVAILGCENSHANAFLKAVINDKLVDDVEFVGIYSDDLEASKKLQDEFGVKVAKSYDEFVGQVDGIIITARHGDNHYKYAKPYIESGIPMFIDKPITCTEEDAKVFMEELIAHKVPVCGGTVCALTDRVQKLKKAVKEEEYGKVFGGYLRAPISMENEYGGFFFYSQHLAQVLTEIFGCYPKSVRVYRNGDTYTCVVRYEEYDVTIAYVEGNYLYYAGISCEKAYVGAEYDFGGCFEREFMEFYDLLKGKGQHQSYKDFFAPVYVLNAINRSLKSGLEEYVNKYEE